MSWVERHAELIEVGDLVRAVPGTGLDVDRPVRSRNDLMSGNIWFGFAPGMAMVATPTRLVEVWVPDPSPAT